ncbi:MAG: exopolysaccharide transport family protein [Pseudomonadota bacterium]
MASYQSSHANAEINLAQILKKLWDARFGVMVFVLLVTGLVYLFTQIAEPKYLSEAQILVEAQETGFTRPEVDDAQVVEQVDPTDVLSEVQAIASRDVSMKVIEQLRLEELEEFDPALEGVSIINSTLVLLGLVEDPLRLSAGERVFQNFDEGLRVYPIPESRVIVVGFESSDPELSARIVDAVIENYLASQQAAQATTTRSATSFLEAEINELRQEVAQAEADVARFRASSGLLLGPNNTTLSAQQLSELSTELTRARADRSEARSRATEIRSLIAAQGNEVALPEDFSTPLTARLQEEQATIRASIAELSATLLPGHPRIRELNAQLGDLGGQLRGEAARVAQRFENAAQVSQARAEALEEQLAQLSAEAARIAESEVQLRALEREAAAQRDLLQSYLVRFREAATRDEPALLPTNARVIQTAQVDREAIFPRTLPMIMIAFVGSFAFAVLGVASQAILSSAVTESEFEDEGFEGEELARDEVAGASFAQQDAQNGSNQTASARPSTRSADYGYAYADGEPIPPQYQSADRSADVLTTEFHDAERSQPNLAERTLGARQPLQPTSFLENTPVNRRPEFQAVPQSGPAPVAAAMPRTFALADPVECRHLFAHLRSVGLGSEALRITVGASDSSINAGDVALRLARATAQAGRSVVFIDCVGDLRGADLTPDGPGFFELITGKVMFDTALHKDPKSSLHVVPAGYSIAERHMVADDAADLVLNAFATSYEAVIVNAGRDPQLLLECARINDVMVLGGQPNRVAALAQTLSSIVPADRMLAVQMPAVPRIPVGAVSA